MYFSYYIYIVCAARVKFGNADDVFVIMALVTSPPLAWPILYYSHVDTLLEFIL